MISRIEVSSPVITSYSIHYTKLYEESRWCTTAALVDEVADGIGRHRFPNYVCDPVMVATSGDRLLDADAVRTVV